MKAHVFESADGVDHLVSCPVLFNQPADHCIDARPVVRTDVRAVPAGMFKMLVLHHWRFVNVVVRGDAGVMRDLG